MTTSAVQQPAREGVPGIVDVAGLDEYFAANVAGAVPPLRYTVIAGGHSNLTYRVDDAAGNRFVLRRPPLGHILASAHDMGREHRIISAVGRSDGAVPVAPALALSADDSVNGAPFYVMGFVDGHVLATEEDVEANVADHTARYRLGEDVADILARLHQLDVDAIGLGELARRDGFLDRQLKRWRGQWEAAKTRELPAMEETYELLLQAKPEQRHTGIVHGDYRLGNMLSLAEGRIAAVLDWELCTLGDVLADVGYLLNNWGEPGDPEIGLNLDPPPTCAPGFPSREAFVARYAERTGVDTSVIAYYQAFSHWRLASIGEGVKRRYLEGVMVDDTFPLEDYDHRIAVRANVALDLIRGLNG
ncbi:MAG: phosphotransferase family protein [Acidimicrobiales bacterium]